MQNSNDRYFSGRPNSIGRDIALLELDCSKNNTGKLQNCLSKSLKTVICNAPANNLTSRVFVVLEFGNTASAFLEYKFEAYEAMYGYNLKVLPKAHE